LFLNLFVFRGDCQPFSSDRKISPTFTPLPSFFYQLFMRSISQKWFDGDRPFYRPPFSPYAPLKAPPTDSDLKILAHTNAPSSSPFFLPYHCLRPPAIYFFYQTHPGFSHLRSLFFFLLCNLFRPPLQCLRDFFANFGGGRYLLASLEEPPALRRLF